MSPLESDERDTILMGLVESALGRAAEERKEFLDTVFMRYPELFDEVKDRVEWEGRMGGFLREPVVLNVREGPENPFSAGELVGGRFRIVRELGRGGMGVVYEAADEKLNRTIAIKCARREFQSRLTPEARAALEVSHPNVCKLHELHTAQTDAGPVDFLTMEFIEGETLFDAIERDGPLPGKKAREIALQICAGLAQAHRLGVVHGDIKSANIILSRTPEGATRTVLTDFGLSKLARERSQSSGDALARARSVQGGTYAYMAPELLTGGRATIASDIYALGVLFHLILNGKLMPKRQLDLPVAIDLPSPWNRVVGRCTEPHPEDRWVSVEAVSAALTGRRAVVKWTLAAALVVIAILASFLWRSREETGPPVRLVVLPVGVEGAAIPSANGVGADVADRLSGARRSFTVIGPQEALRNRVDTLQKARTVLGATHILRTSLRNNAQSIAAEASVADAVSGERLRELKGEYPSADTALIAKALIATVTNAFGLRSRVPRELTTGPAYQDYVEGVALMRRDGHSAAEAIPHFARASQLDPQSALPYAGLAEAQTQKFLRGEGSPWLDMAVENIGKAKSLNPDSVPVLLAAGWCLQQRGRYEQAIGELTRATQLEPQNGDAWRRLAGVYERSNRNAEAIATFQKAIEAQPNYYLHYLTFGNFYLRKSQFQRAEELYRRVTVVAPSLADGHLNLGLALMQQGKFQEAEKEMLESLRLNRDSRTLMNVGALYYAEERFPEAVKFFEEAITLGPPSAVRYRDLGDGYRQMKRLDKAANAYREGKRLAESDVARNPRDGQARVTLALLSALLGDQWEAEFESAQALALEPENTQVMRNAAITYEVLGQRENALAALRTAPPFLIEELNRQPDVKNLRHDPRFQAMMPKISSQ